MNFMRIGRIDEENYQCRAFTLTFKAFSKAIEYNSDGLIKFIIIDNGFGTWKMSYNGDFDYCKGDISYIIEKYLFWNHPNWKVITGAIDPVSDFVVITYKIKGTKETGYPYMILAHKGNKEVHFTFDNPKEMMEYIDYLIDNHYTVEHAMFITQGQEFLPQYTLLRRLFNKGLKPIEIRDKLLEEQIDVDERLMTYIEIKYREKNKKKKRG